MTERRRSRVDATATCHVVRTGNSKSPKQQKAPADAGAFRLFRECRSVPGDGRTAEAIVDAGSHEVSVLLDVVVAGVNAEKVEGVVVGAHEQMVIFDAERPVRSKAIFQAGANRGTPTGVFGTIAYDAE